MNKSCLENLTLRRRRQDFEIVNYANEIPHTVTNNTWLLIGKMYTILNSMPCENHATAVANAVKIPNEKHEEG